MEGNAKEGLGMSSYERGEKRPSSPVNPPHFLPPSPERERNLLTSVSQVISDRIRRSPNSRYLFFHSATSFVVTTRLFLSLSNLSCVFPPSLDPPSHSFFLDADQGINKLPAVDQLLREEAWDKIDITKGMVHSNEQGSEWMNECEKACVGQRTK